MKAFNWNKRFKGRSHGKRTASARKGEDIERDSKGRLVVGHKPLKGAEKGYFAKNHKLFKGAEKGWIKKGQKLRKGLIGYKETELHKQHISDGLKGRMPANKMRRKGMFSNVHRGWYDINGKKIFLRSRWEANIAFYFDFLIKQGEIKSWSYENKVFIFDKIKFGTRSYKPDFEVIEKDGSIVYYEVKGWLNPRSKTQLKRMAKYYPQIKISLIDKDRYRTLAKQLKGMIPNWE